MDGFSAYYISRNFSKNCSYVIKCEENFITRLFIAITFSLICLLIKNQAGEF